MPPKTYAKLVDAIEAHLAEELSPYAYEERTGNGCPPGTMSVAYFPRDLEIDLGKREDLATSLQQWLPFVVPTGAYGGALFLRW